MQHFQGQTVGEVEIMIAEPSARGLKLGWESMLLMLRSEAAVSSNRHSIHYPSISDVYFSKEYFFWIL